MAKNIDEVSGEMRNAPNVLRHNLLRAAVMCALKVQAEVQQRTPTAHGILRNSIMPMPPVNTPGGVEVTVGTPLVYAVPVELGSKAHWPPFPPILNWVEYKLGLRGVEAINKAKHVQWIISKFDQPGRFMFRDGAKASEDFCQRAFARAVEGSL